MDRLSELALDVRAAAVEVVARVELMHDAAPSDVAARQAFLLDIADAFDDLSEAADIGAEHARMSYRAVARWRDG